MDSISRASRRGRQPLRARERCDRYSALGAQLRQELDEVKNYPRTNLTNLTASYWEYYGGRASFEYWANQANRMILEYRLDSNPPQAARVYALTDVAFYDSFVACWDAKYTYWGARPAMLDPEIKTVFVTPNHPSYPRHTAACSVRRAEP